MAGNNVSPIQAGEQFGRLTVLDGNPVYLGKAKAFKCRCSCGERRTVAGFDLRRGRTQSCGCYKVERDHQRALARTLESVAKGHARPEYSVWQSMRQRCTNPNVRKYVDYGGRGVRVCARWMHSFEQFFSDMGPRPTSKHSLDRIDNDGDYEPENCRWALPDVQQNNRRTNRVLTWRGQTHTISEWSRLVGMPVATLHTRVSRGWSTERALSTPVNAKPSPCGSDSASG